MENSWQLLRVESSWAQGQWDLIMKQLFGNDKFNVIVYGTFGLFFGLYWIAGSLFTFVDLTGRPKFMARYKIQENVKNYPLSRADFLDLMKVVLINQSLVFVGLLVAFKFDQWRPIISIGDLPSMSTAIGHLVFSVVVIEVLFYYFHRMLHYPPIYKRIHKKHHTWVSPVAIAAIYCHPFEQILSNIIPTMAGPFFLGSHILLLWAWIGISVLTTLITHSGYHLPFLVSAELHDFHHLKFNYNFGVIGLLDKLHGTDVLFRKSKESIRHRTLLTLRSAKELFP